MSLGLHDVAERYIGERSLNGHLSGYPLHVWFLRLKDLLILEEQRSELLPRKGYLTVMLRVLFEHVTGHCAWQTASPNELEILEVIQILELLFSMLEVLLVFEFFASHWGLLSRVAHVEQEIVVEVWSLLELTHLEVLIILLDQFEVLNIKLLPWFPYSLLELLELPLINRLSE